MLWYDGVEAICISFSPPGENLCGVFPFLKTCFIACFPLVG
jgi:hypothetical protein